MKHDIWLADFETTTGAQSTTESNIYIYGIGKLGDLKRTFKWGLTMEEFLNFIKDNEIKKVMFHNLSWDGNYIFKWLLNNGYEYIDELSKCDTGWNMLASSISKIYSMNVKWKNHLFTINCSYLILVSSVSNLGKLISNDSLNKIVKLDLDYDNYNIFNSKKDVPPELIQYLYRDIEVVDKVITNIFLQDEKPYDMKMTSAGISINSYRKFVGDIQYLRDFGGSIYGKGKTKYINKLNYEQWDIVKKSYIGGYTMANPIYAGKIIDCDGYSADVNSLYPSVMLNNKMPYGDMLIYPPNNSEYITLIEFRILSCKSIDYRYPPMFRNYEKGAKYTSDIPEVEVFTRVLWEKELNFIKERTNLKYRIINKYYFKIKDSFSGWYNVISKYKKEAKEGAMRVYHKRINNSLYGKFGENVYKKTVRIIKDNTPVNEWKKSVERYGKNGEYIKEYVYEKSEKIAYIPVASYTTSLARITVWNAIFGNIDDWLYCDTDSIYCKNKIKNIDIHDSNYGSWKLEYRFNKFKGLRAKTYMYNSTHIYNSTAKDWIEYNETIVKMAGVNNPRGITFDNFKEGTVIKNGVKVKVSVKNGLILYDKDYTINA